MKALQLVLRFLAGLVYRLIVLFLFERWIPFSQRPFALTRPRESEPPTAPGSPSVPKAPGTFDPTQNALSSARLGRVQAPPPPAPPRRVPPVWPPPSTAPRPTPFKGLLRDRGALRDAIVLQSALGARRRRF